MKAAELAAHRAKLDAHPGALVRLLRGRHAGELATLEGHDADESYAIRLETLPNMRALVHASSIALEREPGAPLACGHCGAPATCHAAEAGSGHPPACDSCCAEWCEDGACEPLDGALLEELAITG